MLGKHGESGRGVREILTAQRGLTPVCSVYIQICLTHMSSVLKKQQNFNLFRIRLPAMLEHLSLYQQTGV